MIKAVIYPRYSSDNQREESIEAQVRACSEYAERHSMQVVGIYPDRATTATSDRRPEFLRMMADAEKGMFNAIIVHKLDRFSRDRYDHAFYKRKLKRCGVRLYSVLENLDDSPESVILESVLEGMSEYYSRNLARETLKGMRETAYQCKHTGGVAPLGYDVSADKTYIINEREAEAVRLIFEMYASGQGYNAILEKLNSLGYRSKRGGPFGKNAINAILHNEKYIGVYTFGKTAGGRRDRRNNKGKPEDLIRIPGGIPAILDQELFYRVQDKMGHNQRRSAAYKAKHFYLLSGKLHCGQCGGAMSGESCRNSSGEKAYYYVCSTKKRKRTCDQKSIASHRLDKCVLDYLQTEIFNTKSINEVSKLLYEFQEKKKQEIKDSSHYIREQLADIKRRKNNLMAAIEDGVNTPTTRARLAELEENEFHLNEELVRAEISDTAAIMSYAQIRAGLARFENIINLPQEAQREAVEIFVDKAVFAGDSIEVYMNLGKLLQKKESEQIEDSGPVSLPLIYSDSYYGGDGN